MFLFGRCQSTSLLQIFLSLTVSSSVKEMPFISRLEKMVMNEFLTPYKCPNYRGSLISD